MSFADLEPEKINSFILTFGKSGYWISGPNTYGYRSKFQEYGGEWNKFRGAWYIRDSDGTILQKIREYLAGISIADKGFKIDDVSSGLSGFLLKGDTYLFRYKIKSIGGEWRATEKGWYFSASLRDEVTKEFKISTTAVM